ncbi:phosphatidylglycerophosphatase C [Escherichia coli]|nr:phosphatidylglycerophosphatase C [Escherichia coli]
MATHERRVVFFDLDGTLHQQDMFGSFFALFTASPTAECVACPAVVADHSHCVIDKRPCGTLADESASVGMHFGHNEARLQALQADFVRWFRDNVTAFPLVQERLTTYLLSSDADIWLITGSPQPLVEAVYFDTPWLPRINLIASQIQRGYGGWVLTMRCLGHEKVAQLERKIGTPLRLYSGYSDSNQDTPLLYFCQHRWRVTPRGELQQLE